LLIGAGALTDVLENDLQRVCGRYRKPSGLARRETASWKFASPMNRLSTLYRRHQRSPDTAFLPGLREVVRGCIGFLRVGNVTLPINSGTLLRGSRPVERIGPPHLG